MADRYGDDRMRNQTAYRRAPTGWQEHARPGFGGAGWALAGAAGLAALAILGAQRPGQPARERARDGDAAKGWSSEPEVERSITIERPADELYRAWRDPATLPRIMGFLADISPSDDGASEWQVHGPLGRSYAWTMRITEERPGELIRASSNGGHGALVTESEVRFRPAQGDRGTVATLRVRFDPPGGMLGDVAARFFDGVVPKELASKALRHFKSLVVTGEIPTTDRQPAARPDPR
jgi:uncharacterized membrane protein